MNKIIVWTVSILCFVVVIASAIGVISESWSDQQTVLEVFGTMILGIAIQVILPYISTVIYRRKGTTLSYFIPTLFVLFICCPICLYFLYTIPTWDALYFGLLLVLFVLGMIQATVRFFLVRK